VEGGTGATGAIANDVNGLESSVSVARVEGGSGWTCGGSGLGSESGSGTLAVVVVGGGEGDMCSDPKCKCTPSKPAQSQPPTGGPKPADNKKPEAPPQPSKEEKKPSGPTPSGSTPAPPKPDNDSKPKAPEKPVSPPAGPGPSPSKAPTTWSPGFEEKRRKILQDAVLDTLSGRNSTDTEVSVFSQRSRKGVIHGVKTVHVRSSLLLAASASFATLIAKHPCGTGHVTSRRATSAEYDYDEDSDLEDVDMSELEGLDQTLSSLSTASQRSSTPSSNEAQGITITEGDAVKNISSQGSETVVDYQRASEASRQCLNRGTGSISRDETAKGENLKAIARIMPDCAYRTWQMLIVYLHNDLIEFSDLKSQRHSDSRSKTSELSCSPKSMYRLADKFDLEHLKKLTSEAISSRLSSENIIQELFSDFTWRYPEILKMETELYFKLSKDPKVRASLNQACKKIAAGGYPNSGVVLASLFGGLTQ